MSTRTATAILEARGAFAKNPDRKRVDPVVSNPFPTEAPSELDPIEVKWWHKLVKQVPDGVLTGADQAAMMVAACLFAEYMTDRRGMATSRIAQMMAVMAKFGLSPTDRAKLATAPVDDNSEF